MSKKAALVGTANQYITLGMLLPEFPETMLCSHDQSAQDMFIADISPIRIQIKTASKSIKFTGGTRGGVDRTYDKTTNQSKEYKYSTKDTDLIIGVHENARGKYELYFVPSIVIDKLDQKGISINKVAFTKNDYDVIRNCKDEQFCEDKFGALYK